MPVFKLTTAIWDSFCLSNFKKWFCSFKHTRNDNYPTLNQRLQKFFRVPLIKILPGFEWYPDVIKWNFEIKEDKWNDLPILPGHKEEKFLHLNRISYSVRFSSLSCQLFSAWFFFAWLIKCIFLFPSKMILYYLLIVF